MSVPCKQVADLEKREVLKSPPALMVEGYVSFNRTLGIEIRESPLSKVGRERFNRTLEVSKCTEVFADEEASGFHTLRQ